MDFLELAKQRYSCRALDTRPVEPQKLDAILQAARLAPTACNNQPQRIYVLQSADALAKLREVTPYHFGAPLALLVCYDAENSWKNRLDGRDSGAVDAAIVTTQMMLEVAQLGLGTTFVGYFDENVARKAFDLPENIHPVAILPLGYPKPDAAPAPQHTKREELEKTVKYL